MATAVVMLLVGGGATAAGFFAYQHYNPATRYTGPLVVLVSTHQIVKGTPANVVLKRARYELRTITPSQVERGAFSDPSALTDGKVALLDIPPGAQLTAADFGPSNP
jgi:hypothetical protein